LQRLLTRRSDNTEIRITRSIRISG
jgi:hypothetical protein